MNVLGTIVPDEFSEHFGTGFQKFESATGIDGLAKVRDSTLHVLVLVATNPNQGSFRNFIQQAKNEFQCICIWEIWNPSLAAKLEEYGFHPHQEIDMETSDLMKGYRWMAD